MESGFPHESLDCYRLAVGVARWTATSQFPPRQGDLQEQAVRAAQSIALNIAEGWGRVGAARTNHFRIALGSAAEVCAVLDLVDLTGGADRQAELRRIGAMLRRLGA